MRRHRLPAGVASPFVCAMARPAASTAVPFAIALVVGALVVGVASRLADHFGASRPYEVRFLPEGRALRFLSPAAKLSLANAYWLATVQYIGDQHMSRGGYDRLYALVDLVTDLDPLHGYAYQTAGLNLSSAGRLEESDRILKKGMESGPNWWSYPFYLAFNDYFYRGDYPSAARWARIAARTPGASTNIAHLALALEVKSGDPAAGLALIEELLKTTTEPTIRERLEEQHKLARLQVSFAVLDDAVARYRAQYGLTPASPEQLLWTRTLPALPEEPFGGRFVIGPDGQVSSTGSGFRFKPREEGRGVPAPPGPPAGTPAGRKEPSP